MEMMHATVNEYARVLVRLMFKAGFTHTRIALESNVSYQKICDISKGDSHNISFDTLRRIEQLATRVADGEVKCQPQK